MKIAPKRLKGKRIFWGNKAVFKCRKNGLTASGKGYIIGMKLSNPKQHGIGNFLKNLEAEDPVYALVPIFCCFSVVCRIFSASAKPGNVKKQEVLGVFYWRFCWFPCDHSRSNRIYLDKRDLVRPARFTVKALLHSKN